MTRKELYGILSCSPARIETIAGGGGQPSQSWNVGYSLFQYSRYSNPLNWGVYKKAIDAVVRGGRIGGEVRWLRVVMTVNGQRRHGADGFGEKEVWRRLNG